MQSVEESDTHMQFSLKKFQVQLKQEGSCKSSKIEYKGKAEEAFHVMDSSQLDDLATRCISKKVY